MEVLEKAYDMEREGENIIHLEVGETDFETPQCIKDACTKALREGKTRYTHSLGLWELREAVARYLLRRYSVNISPHRIVITMGTSPALFLLFSTLLDRGDEIIITNPYYSCYPNMIRFLGGKVVPVNVREEHGYQYQIETLLPKLTKKTKAVLINSPANPTGALLSPQIMREIAAMGHYIISDEIYHGLVYATREHSILEFTNNAFVLGGFSKKYAMTGWRLGYLIVPEKFVRPLQKVQQNFFISANSFVQWAAIAALEEAENDVEIMRKTLNERRLFILQRLRELGFQLRFEPQGAFYVLANAKRFSNDSRSFAFDILSKAKVAVAPGIDFGDNAEGHIRFSYANSLQNIQEAMNRLQRYFAAL